MTCLPLPILRRRRSGSLLSFYAAPVSRTLPVVALEATSSSVRLVNTALSLTRSGVAWGWNDSGVLVQYPANTPALDYRDGVWHMLSEHSGSNLLPEAFDFSAWDTAGSGVSMAAGDAITSTGLTETVMTFDGTSTKYIVEKCAISASTVYTASIVISQGTSPVFQFEIDDRNMGGNRFRASYTWATGATTLTQTVDKGDGAAVVLGKATPLPGGRVLLEATFTTGSSATIGVFMLRHSSAGTAGVFGAQWEAGYNATSRMLSDGSAASRSASTAFSLDLPSGLTEATIVVTGKFYGSAQNAGFARVWQGVPSNFTYLHRRSTLGTLRVDETSGSAALSAGGSLPAGDSFIAAVGMKANDLAVSMNGNETQKDTSYSFNAPTSLSLGAFGSGQAEFGISSLIVFDARLDDVDLWALSPRLIDPVAWGDSMTASAGATSGATRYPAVAGGLFDPIRTVSNLGIGGQTSTQIAARQGGVPITVTVSGNEIPTSGGVSVTDKSVNILYESGSFTGTATGTLAGVAGTMATDGSGNWTFTRAASGDATACPAGTAFVPDTALALRGRTAWLWLGRNNFADPTQVKADIASCIAHLSHSRYLVCSVLPSAADTSGQLATIASLNADLATLYGSAFVDLLTPLQDAGDGSPDDNADIAAGIIPRSLRSDATPLNDAGYAIVAAEMYAAELAVRP